MKSPSRAAGAEVGTLLQYASIQSECRARVNVRSLQETHSFRGRARVRIVDLFVRLGASVLS
jgi:hypothetical protein